MTQRVFLAGEGRTDIGSAGAHPSYQAPGDCGVLGALLSRLVDHEFEVVGGVYWKKIRHFKPGSFRSREERLVLGLALMAKEAFCDVVGFCRDRDGDSDREQDVENAIDDVTGIQVAGGVAIEETEAWVLALLGETGSESHADPKSVLHDRGVGTSSQMVDIVNDADLGGLPLDAASLVLWIGRVRNLSPPP